MKLPPLISLPPHANEDVTEAFRRNLALTQPTSRQWYFWPLKFVISTTLQGSKIFMLEFRPIKKFCLAVNFFWKSNKGGPNEA